MESDLRGIIRDYTNTYVDDEAWTFFEGQSWDWLTGSLRALIKGYEKMRTRDGWRPEREAFLKSLEGLDQVRDRRNFVIHSVWYPKCPWIGESGWSASRSSKATTLTDTTLSAAGHVRCSWPSGI